MLLYLFSSNVCVKRATSNWPFTSIEITLFFSLHLKCKLSDAESIAKDAIGMLLYEPATNPEGMLAKQAMFELKEMRLMKQRVEKSMKKSSSRKIAPTKTKWFLF